MQEYGIVTGDNHSVSIANMAVHCIVETEHTTVNKSKLFVCFIDDILWISEGLEQWFPTFFLLVAHFHFENFPWPTTQSIVQELDQNFHQF